MSRTITLYMCNNALKTDLIDIPEKLLDGVFEALMQGAYLVKGLAQVYVRVDTGSLRDSIRVERGGQGMKWRRVRVRAGGYVTNPITGRRVDYAGHVEAKYPYLRPAINDALPEINDALTLAGEETLERLPSTKPAC